MNKLTVLYPDNGILFRTKKKWGFPGGAGGKKNPPANAGGLREVGSVPGWGRAPGGGNGTTPQYSCLENPMDSGAWWATVIGSQSWI